MRLHLAAKALKSETKNTDAFNSQAHTKSLQPMTAAALQTYPFSCLAKPSKVRISLLHDSSDVLCPWSMELLWSVTKHDCVSRCVACYSTVVISDQLTNQNTSRDMFWLVSGLFLATPLFCM